MDKAEIRKELQSYLKMRKNVKLTRSIPSQLRHDGFLVALGPDWLVMHQFHDFYPDGYTALRINDIKKIRSGENERFWERMLEAEGLLSQITLPYDLPLENLSRLLKALQERANNVIVECESEKEDVEDFYIGKILSVSDSFLTFANFNGLGQWDENPHKISISEITRLQFETPYTRIYSKYLVKPCHLAADTE